MRKHNDSGNLFAAASAEAPLGAAIAAQNPTDEERLRKLAREAIAAGMLPSLRASRLWGGPGIGAGCAVCGQPVGREELGFELELGAGSGERHFHVRCFAAWDVECQQQAAAE